MRIKNGSICIFDLESKVKEMLNKKGKKGKVDIQLMFNYNQLLSKYNYDIALIDEKEQRDACTVEGFANFYDLQEILTTFPFKL